MPDIEGLRMEPLKKGGELLKTIDDEFFARNEFRFFTYTFEVMLRSTYAAQDSNRQLKSRFFKFQQCMLLSLFI